MDSWSASAKGWPRITDALNLKMGSKPSQPEFVANCPARLEGFTFGNYKIIKFLNKGQTPVYAC